MPTSPTAMTIMNAQNCDVPRPVRTGRLAPGKRPSYLRRKAPLGLELHVEDLRPPVAPVAAALGAIPKPVFERHVASTAPGHVHVQHLAMCADARDCAFAAKVASGVRVELDRLRETTGSLTAGPTPTSPIRPCAISGSNQVQDRQEAGWRPKPDR